MKTKHYTGRFANKSVRQQPTGSPTYELVDSPTVECQFANAYMPVTSGANIQNTFFVWLGSG